MRGKQFLYIVIATFVTVIIWVTLDILHSRAAVQTPPEIKQVLEPINPNFDQDAINKL
ncbi:MAG: hypothetical protein Q7S44_02880 [bacterium]|nr:hypothetical protein [bacterium]